MTNETIHTPGAWRIGDAGRTVFGPKTEHLAPVAIAELPLATPRVSAEERRANAALIAAAPELLEALEFVKDHIERLSLTGDVLQCVCKIDGVIAKAKGQ